MRELLYRLEPDPVGHYISTGHYGGIEECEEHCKEWAGYIPHIFAEAVMLSDERGDVSLDAVAQSMDDVYGFGVFVSNGWRCGLGQRCLFIPRRSGPVPTGRHPNAWFRACWFIRMASWR
jgi:hypothetical protein